MYKFQQIFDPIRELLTILGESSDPYIEYVAYDIYAWLWSLANNAKDKNSFYKEIVLRLHPDVCDYEYAGKIFSYINAIKDGMAPESIRQKLREILSEDGQSAFSILKTMFEPIREDERNRKTETPEAEEIINEIIKRREKERERREEAIKNEEIKTVPTYKRKREINQKRKQDPVSTTNRPNSEKWKKQKEETRF